MGRNLDDKTGDLEAVVTRLRDAKPEATALELDRIKRRAIAQASAGAIRAPRKGLFMKPRIAVVFVLSLGLLMGGTGATLAVMSDSESAGKVQYPDLNENAGAKDEVGDVLGSEEESGAQNQNAGSEEDNGGGSGPAVQEERQVASSGGGEELPFTGFLAIPLLIVGVMLLVAGGVMRTRTRTRTRTEV